MSQRYHLVRLFCATLLLVVFGAWGCSSNGDVIGDEPMGGGPVDTDFDDWDANDDGLLDEDEFGKGLAEKEVFEKFDRNADERLDEQEFTVNAEDYGLVNVEFNAFDADGNDFIDGDEFESGLFDTYDTDDSDFIETDEFAPGLI